MLPVWGDEPLDGKMPRLYPLVWHVNSSHQDCGVWYCLQTNMSHGKYDRSKYLAMLHDNPNVLHAIGG